MRTKLHIPSARLNPVKRPRLFHLLRQALTLKLTLVSAPAGFGKTTLLSQWRASASMREQAVAWLSLDEADNDPIRFWTYLVHALRTLEPEIGGRTLAQLHASKGCFVESALIQLINDVTAILHDLTVILDDYHLIQAESIHRDVTFLLEHMPGHMHFVLASRSVPPLPLARLRGRGQLLEVRTDDLRFTGEETTRFLNHTMGLNLTPQQIAVLEVRTEGWIIGLQMAALSIRRQASVSEFLARFGGDDRHIRDYLVQEVLSGQPHTIQEFLLQTSILDRLTASLCNAVTQREDGQAQLELLETGNLFIIPLDNQQRWYRYHPFFAQAMVKCLESRQPELIPILHRRAAEWCQQNNLLAEAVEHALQATGNLNAALLIERAIPALTARGQFVTLVNWLERLPVSILHANADLCATRAWIAMRQHELDQAEKWLDVAQAALQAQRNDDLKIWSKVNTIRVDLALNRGQVAASIELACKTLATLPKDEDRLRGELLLLLGVGYYWNAQWAAADETYAQAGHYAVREADMITAVFALSNRARILVIRGQMRRAMAALEQLWDYASKHDLQQLPLMAGYSITIGEILYEWNRLDAAEQHVTDGLRLARQAQNPRTLLRGHARQISLLRAAGKLAEAHRVTREILHLTRHYQMSIYNVNECAPVLVRYWLERNDRAAIEAWMHERGLQTDAQNVTGKEQEYCLLARALGAWAHYKPAQRLLARVTASAHTLGALHIYLEALVLHSIILQRVGKQDDALQALTQALALAEPEGYVRTFIDEGEPMAQLLRLVVSHQSKPDYAAGLLALFAGATTTHLPTPARAAEPTLVEPLSRRELELLYYLASGLTDQEVAETLSITVGTVKTHARNIYSKLGVRNRTQAAARARELNLLSP